MFFICACLARALKPPLLLTIPHCLQLQVEVVLFVDGVSALGSFGALLRLGEALTTGTAEFVRAWEDGGRFSFSFSGLFAVVRAPKILVRGALVCACGLTGIVFCRPKTWSWSEPAWA